MRTDSTGVTNLFLCVVGDFINIFNHFIITSDGVSNGLLYSYYILCI